MGHKWVNVMIIFSDILLNEVGFYRTIFCVRGFSGVLTEQYPKILFDLIPIIWIKPSECVYSICTISRTLCIFFTSLMR